MCRVGQKVTRFRKWAWLTGVGLLVGSCGHAVAMLVTIKSVHISKITIIILLVLSRHWTPKCTVYNTNIRAYPYSAAHAGSLMTYRCRLRSGRLQPGFLISMRNTTNKNKLHSLISRPFSPTRPPGSRWSSVYSSRTWNYALWMWNYALSGQGLTASNICIKAHLLANVNAGCGLHV